MPEQMTLQLQAIRKILVSRLKFMGDVILTTPLIRSVRKAYPHAYIAYLTESHYAPLLENNPYLDEIIAFERKRSLHLSPLQGWKQQFIFVRELRRKKFDLTIDLLGMLPSALLTYVSGARYRVGGNYRIRKHFYNLIVSDNSSWKTAIDYHGMSLKALNIVPDGDCTEVFLTPAEKEWAEAYLVTKGFDCKRPIVGLHPGGKWPAKLWPWPRFAELAQRLIEELGAQVLITLGPNERGLAQRVASKAGTEVVVGDVLNLRQLAAVLSKLHLYIATDGGPMHLAVAVGTRTFGIFGPGEPDIWFPYSQQQGHRAIFTPISCRPCHLHECPSMACMNRITVNEILQTVKESWNALRTSKV